VAAYLTLVWPRLIRWGATDQEVRRSFPAAQHAPSPMYRSTRTIEIRATPSVVWAWLVQLGQGRGGFYSYTWLENLVGADIHNATRIRPDLQHLQVGDTVRLAPAGFLGGGFDHLSQLRVAAIEPERLLVLRGWGTFALDSLSGAGTRLLIREETPLPSSAWKAALLKLTWEPLHFVMERQMLRGIRDRSEGRASPWWVSGLATLGFAVAAGMLVVALARRRPGRVWLLWPLAGAIAVILGTGDVHAALAGFVGTGTAILGALLAGRHWWKWFAGILAMVCLVLLLAHDAYVTLGWLLGVVAFLVSMAKLKRPAVAVAAAA
jgi:hypothetical protein